MSFITIGIQSPTLCKNHRPLHRSLRNFQVSSLNSFVELNVSNSTSAVPKTSPKKVSERHGSKKKKSKFWLLFVMWKGLKVILYPSISIDLLVWVELWDVFGCLVQIFAVVRSDSCTLGSQMIAVGLCSSQSVHVSWSLIVCHFFRECVSTVLTLFWKQMTSLEVVAHSSIVTFI